MLGGGECRGRQHAVRVMPGRERVGMRWRCGRSARTGRRSAPGQGRARLRFAFYGRVPAEDHQDPVTSRARQREQAAALVAGQGQIVAEFFVIASIVCS